METSIKIGFILFMLFIILAHIYITKNWDILEPIECMNATYC